MSSRWKDAWPLFILIRFDLVFTIAGDPAPSESHLKSHFSPQQGNVSAFRNTVPGRSAGFEPLSNRFRGRRFKRLRVLYFILQDVCPASTVPNPLYDFSTPWLIPLVLLLNLDPMISQLPSSDQRNRMCSAERARNIVPITASNIQTIGPIA